MNDLLKRLQCRNIKFQLKHFKQYGMVNTVKSRTEIQQTEGSDEARINCYVIIDFKNRCFSRMEAMETRLNEW